MKEDDKDAPKRPADIVVPMGQPLPTLPGIEWWLKHMIKKSR
jgi:hypothetical protein